MARLATMFRTRLLGMVRTSGARSTLRNILRCRRNKQTLRNPVISLITANLRQSAPYYRGQRHKFRVVEYLRA